MLAYIEERSAKSIILCFHSVKCFFPFHMPDYAIFICHLQWFCRYFHASKSFVYFHLFPMFHAWWNFQFIWISCKIQNNHNRLCILYFQQQNNLKCFLCHNGIRMSYGLWEWEEQENIERKTHLVTSWTICEVIVNAIYCTHTSPFIIQYMREYRKLRLLLRSKFSYVISVMTQVVHTD